MTIPFAIDGPAYSFFISYLDSLVDHTGPTLAVVRGTIIEQMLCKISLLDASTRLRAITGTDELAIQINQVQSYIASNKPPVEEISQGPVIRCGKCRLWTSLEDLRLVAGLEKYSQGNWKLISKFVGSGRTRAQCSQRWCRALDPHLHKRGWSEEEDKLLVEYVEQFGARSWAKVSKAMQNRSDVQCRYRYLHIQSCYKLRSKVASPQKMPIPLLEPKPFPQIYFPPFDAIAAPVETDISKFLEAMQLRTPQPNVPLISY